MSDHEGDGLDLDKWEVASLPGTTYSFGIDEGHGAGLYANQDAGLSRQAVGRPPSQQLLGHGGPQSQGHNIAQLLGPTTNGHLNTPVHGLYSASRRTAAPVSAAQDLFQRGESPSGKYELNVPWKQLCMEALRMDLGSSIVHPRVRLKEIMRLTDTYLKEPINTGTEVLIWGDTTCVANAKRELELLEKNIQSVPKGKSEKWLRFHALDGRAEQRKARLMEQKELHTSLVKANIEFPIEAVILWPKNLDMGAFIDHHSSTIESIEETQSCRIEMKNSEECRIDIGVYKKEDLKIVIRRLTNLVKEIVAHRDQLIKVNLVHFPSSQIYRHQVGLGDRDIRTNSFLPTLFGEPVSDVEAWENGRVEKHHRNRRRTRKAIDDCIKTLRISQRHVRLRVAFGELAFHRFHKPANGADAYSFEEFYRMVTETRTKLLLNSLPVRQGHPRDLAEAISSLGPFKDPTISYGAFFDFLPSKSVAERLRLECVFGTLGETEEFEVRERRWIKYGDMVQRLEVSHLNFEGPDYQVTIDAFPLHDDRRISNDLAAFQRSIKFRPPGNAMKADPIRRVQFSPTSSALESVSDITVMRWRFKDTDGFFELRRKDTYDSKATMPPREPSRWHAFYYYPEWDNLMGHFANARPGEDVQWEKSIATFFPESGEDEGLALPRGFQNFIEEVEEIQGLLGEAIAKVAKKA